MGIRELKYPSGKVSYQAECRIKGHPAHRRTFHKRREAEKWFKETNAHLIATKHHRVIDTSRFTVKMLIERFIEYVKARKINNKNLVGQLKWWDRQLGHLYLSNLRPNKISSCVEVLLKETNGRGELKKPSTINRYLCALSKALNVAVREWEWMDKNPVKAIYKLKEPMGRERYLSVKEKDKLLEACLKSRNVHLHSIVSLAILTGMRYSEITNLTKQDIDYETNLITLQKTKNGERRYVPITHQVKIILNASILSGMQDTDRLFESGNPNNTTGRFIVRRSFMTALEEAGIENFRFHDLRHTAASYMAMTGATQGELMAILGHKTSNMTKRYTHYHSKHLENLMTRTENKFFAKGMNPYEY